PKIAPCPGRSRPPRAERRPANGPKETCRMLHATARHRPVPVPTRLLALALLAGRLIVGLTPGPAAPAAQPSPFDPGQPAHEHKPSPKATPDVAEVTKTINEKLEAGWKANKVTPSRPVDDYEFIRRASLDIIGRIAKPEEIETYLKDPPETRRALLIDR